MKKRSWKKLPLAETSLGYNCYKVRLSIKRKGKGKSGGGRVITLVKFIKEEVHLLSIFDKSKKDTITDKELIKQVIS